MSQPEARRRPPKPPPAPPVVLSGASTVTLNQTTITLSAAAQPGGVLAEVDCNGQQVKLFFDGTNIEVEVREPAGQ